MQKSLLLADILGPEHIFLFFSVMHLACSDFQNNVTLELMETNPNV